VTLLKTQTAQSTVYREEQRDIAVGERIRFTYSDRDAHIRFGNFAILERIGEDNALSVRLDSGKAVELDSNKALHLEYGYAVETAPRASVDRVLVTGDASQLAQQQDALALLSPHIRDLALYTSDSRELAVEKAIPDVAHALSQHGLSPADDRVPMPSVPQIELEELGIGL
jgi:hypothetical protein